MDFQTLTDYDRNSATQNGSETEAKSVEDGIKKDGIDVAW